MRRISRRSWLATACATAAAPLFAQPRTPPRIVQIGWLGWLGGPGAKYSEEPLKAFRDGLAKHGWQGGRSVLVDARSGDQGLSRELAKAISATGIQVLVCEGPMVFGARDAVPADLPIVFSINGDPVEAGLVESLARPGGHLTGITALSAELSVKRVELLKQIVPGLTRIAAIANQSHPGVRVEFEATTEAAKRLGLTLQWLSVYRPDDFAGALQSAQREQAGAIVAIPDNLVNSQSETIATFCAKARIPAVSGWAQFAQAGNVLSYGPELRAFYARLGVYVDKILRGTRASDLPVERPSEFELVVNAVAAQRIGLAIPQSVLIRANTVIR